MKRFFLSALAVVVVMTASAVLPKNIFDHVGLNLGVGTNGISIEASTPITSYVQMRAGASFMPGITFNADADVNYTVAGMERTSEATLKGDLGRAQGQVIFNVYPAPKVPFYIAVGAYFGGSSLLKITGHCDDLVGMSENGSVTIGDYTIPVDEQGNVSGGIKVNGFRPYLGIGWGRAVPSKRVNFSVDLGVQIHGKPKLYTDFGEIDVTEVMDDNTFNKIMDKVTVYPTLTFRLGFRAY